MARLIRAVQINGQDARALFDTGSIGSYIRVRLGRSFPRARMKKPVRVGLGGQVLNLKAVCIVEAELEGHPFDFEVYPIQRIGRDETGREIDLLIGALAMEKWGLVLDPRTRRIDLRRLKRREFTEYMILKRRRHA
jgi:hypothetical protein